MCFYLISDLLCRFLVLFEWPHPNSLLFLFHCLQIFHIKKSTICVAFPRKKPELVSNFIERFFCLNSLLLTAVLYLWAISLISKRRRFGNLYRLLDTKTPRPNSHTRYRHPVNDFGWFNVNTAAWITASWRRQHKLPKSWQLEIKAYIPIHLVSMNIIQLLTQIFSGMTTQVFAFS